MTGFDGLSSRTKTGKVGMTFRSEYSCEESEWTNGIRGADEAFGTFTLAARIIHK